MASAQTEPGEGRMSENEVREMRRGRRHPRPTQFDYLYMRRLGDSLRTAFAAIDHPVRDVLDIFCGSRPYDDLLPTGARCVGMDVTDRYGTADVVTEEFLPFPDQSFDLVMCIEAFYHVADSKLGVAEMRRVLRPGGSVVIAVHFAFDYDPTDFEHRFTPLSLMALFADWEDVRVVENGGWGVSLATLNGRVIRLKQPGLQSWLGRLTRPLFAIAYLALNAIGWLIDRRERRSAGHRRLPPSFTLSARRPPDA